MGPRCARNPVGGAFVPDAAESFETSPDGLTITFKLRQGMKFDPRPPTDGRDVTTEDVEFSWNRLVAGGLTRFDYANELSPAGLVSDIEAVDDTTVVCTLAFPIANMVSRFAFHRFLSILPAEADGGFDSQNDQRGSGPWRLRDWEPSVGYTYDRNRTGTFARASHSWTPLSCVSLPSLPNSGLSLEQAVSGRSRPGRTAFPQATY